MCPWCPLHLRYVRICCVRVVSTVCIGPVVTLTLCPLCVPSCVVCPFCPWFVRCVRCVHVVSVMSSASVVSLLCLCRGEPKEDATKLKTVLFTVGGNGRNHHRPLTGGPSKKTQHWFRHKGQLAMDGLAWPGLPYKTLTGPLRDTYGTAGDLFDKLFGEGTGGKGATTP